MSKLTLEEAISHCLEVAEQNEKKAEYRPRMDSYDEIESRADCLECAADHRQLAEWLTELKKFREVYGVCPCYEMCIPECKEGYNTQIAEYKQLLKAAVEDMAGMQFGKECKICSKNLLPNECPIHNNVACILEKDFKWRYADEALALIGEEGENDA